MDFKLVYEYTKELTVLYVEDNESLRESTYKVFNNFFKQVDIAIDGDDGLEMYSAFHQKHGEYYDLVISDINMPVMDGVEMGQEILVHNFAQSIIYITAYNEISYLLEAIKMGVSGFLIKPLKIDEFANMLYKVCQSICDRKMVDQHYDQIEEMAMQMQSQNDELQKKNDELEKSMRVLDTMVYKEHHVQVEKTVELEPCLLANDTERIQEQISYLVKDDLPELKELHHEIDSLLIEIISCNGDLHSISENIPEMATHFSSYASILQLYSFYGELSKSMLDLTHIIKSVQLPDEEESRLNIFLFLESFMHVLGKWQDDLALLQQDKLNYLDASMISDMVTISNMWKQEVAPIEEFELELF